MSPKGVLIDHTSERDKARARICENEKKPKPKHVEIVVCGHPRIVKRFIRQVNKEKDLLKQYNISFSSAKEKLSHCKADLFLCLFDVCSSKTLTYLKDKVIPRLTKMEDKLTVAGMGVENRRLMGSSETNFGSCMKLAKDLNCPGTELISVDAKQLIAGAFALYARVYPNDFHERQLNLIEDPAERRKVSRERSRTRAKSMTSFVIEFK